MLAFIPYFEQFSWPDPPLAGLFAIRGFGLMVVTAIVVGYLILQRRARQRGLDPDVVSDFVFYTVLIGFLGSHVFDVIFYNPHKLAQDPLVLLKFWDGISSLGGWLSGIIGAYVFFRLHPQLRAWDFLDCLGFAWPFAWGLARCGCFMAHDHPGAATDFFLAVDFPEGLLGPGSPGGPHHDLGLYEALYMVPIMVIFMALNRRWRHRGFFMGLFLVLYAPMRFGMDYLRLIDKRWFGLTMAQYLAVVCLLAGLYILIKKPGGTDLPAEPQAA